MRWHLERNVGQAVLLAGLLQKKSQEGTQTTMEATLMAQQTPAQREQVSHTMQHPSRHSLPPFPACFWVTKALDLMSTGIDIFRSSFANTRIPTI